MIHSKVDTCNSQVISKGWGFEKVIHNDKDYCGKELVLYQGKKCSIHYHKIKKETFYVINGSMVVELYSAPFHLVNNDLQETLLSLQALEEIYYKVIRMNTGDSLVIEPFTPHRFIGVDDETHFIEFSTQHFDDDSYRIYPGDSQDV